MFITFEGGEGAGKSTQIRLLKKVLEREGHEVVLTREPGGCAVSEALRDLFVEHKGQNWDVTSQAMLMFTARSLHVNEVILPALKNNQIVLCDRFTDSTRVYQGIAGGLGLEKLEQIKQTSIGDLEPDLTFIFDLDVEEGLARASGRNSTEDSFESKDGEFHQSLREGFQKIAQLYPERCILIDAAQDINTISDAIWTHVQGKIA